MNARRATRIAVPAVALLVTGAIAIPAQAMLPPHPAAPAASRATNRAATRAEVRHLLAERRLPAPASVLHGRPPKILRRPAESVAASERALVRRTRFFHTDLALHRALHWIEKHPPAGLRSEGTGSTGTIGGRTLEVDATFSDRGAAAYAEPELEYSVARPRHGSGTVWRVDGMALVVDPRPIADHVKHPLRVRTSTGCPTGDSGHDGVRNQGPGLNHHLVPAGKPTGAIICVFGGLNSKPRFTLLRQRTVRAFYARRIARGARHVRLGHIDGIVTSCPMDDGSVTAIALSYPHRRDVDLWYARTGCTSVANGVVVSGNTGGGALFYREVGRLSRAH